MDLITLAQIFGLFIAVAGASLFAQHFIEVMERYASMPAGVKAFAAQQEAYTRAVIDATGKGDTARAEALKKEATEHARRALQQPR